MQILSGNWVDLVILLIFIFFILESLKAGFWVMLVDFVSFFGSLFIALAGYGMVASFLRTNFALSRAISNALGFLATAIIVESVLGVLLGRLLRFIPEKSRDFPGSKVFAALPALGEAIVLVAFLLTLALTFPIQPRIKTDIDGSVIGSYLVQKTSGVEAGLNDIFGGVIEDSLTYFTIHPGSKESIPLESEIEKLTVDEEAENAMFSLVNQERRKVGVRELTWRPEVVPVARTHATDMWERKYFSHFSPEGKDVGDRLNEAGVSYSFAGENLALAPTTQTAHTGFMNSEGHRENILDPRFHQMGIGVIDNGHYGKMFVQIFTD